MLNNDKTNLLVRMISMLKPNESWVARYNKLLPNIVPGCYAVSVSGDMVSDDEGNYNGEY